MKNTKLILTICLVLIFIDSTAQATFDKDFAGFLSKWDQKAELYLDRAHKLMLIIWGGGILTLAAASMPFLERKAFKIASFILALIGAAITQYLVTFEVDPKMMAKKAITMQLKIEDFESKVKQADLNDSQISKQLIIEKTDLDITLTELDHEIRGISDQLTSNDEARAPLFQTASFRSYQNGPSCIATILDAHSGEFHVGGRKINIPLSLSNRIAHDASNLFMSGAGLDNDLNKALIMSDACISNSIRSFFHPLIKGENLNEEAVVKGMLNLSNVLYKNYLKNADGTYQAFKIVSIPKSAAVDLYSDVYSNYEKASFKENNLKLRTRITSGKIIRD